MLFVHEIAAFEVIVESTEGIRMIQISLVSKHESWERGYGSLRTEGLVVSDGAS